MTLISLAALTVLDAGPEGQIRAAAEAGFQTVGLRLNPLLASDAVVIGDARREREIARLLADRALKVLEVGVMAIRPETDPAVLHPLFAFSAAIGARFLVCPVEDPDPGRSLETFGRLCEAAGSHGLAALVEFNPYSACPSLAAALSLVTGAGRANAGLCIDALHLSRSGGRPEDVREIDPALLPLLHFCDAGPPPASQPALEDLRAESRTGRLLPGEGRLPLHALLAALPPDVAISVEAPVARLAHLPAAERARRALAATRAVLEARGER